MMVANDTLPPGHDLYIDLNIIKFDPCLIPALPADRPPSPGNPGGAVPPPRGVLWGPRTA